MSIQDIRYKHTCDNCSDIFPTFFKLSEHNNLHTNEKPFMCPTCGEAFALIELYVDHYRKLPQKHYFSCNDCFAGFTQLQDLESHHCPNATHVSKSNPSPGLTDPSHTSNVVLNQEQQLFDQNLHVEAVGGLETNDCGQSISRDENEIIPPVKYTCTGCNKIFSSAKQLKLHQKQFPGNHRYDCNWCSKSFTSKGKLEKHLCFLARGEAVKCSCLKTFHSTSLFREHIGPKPHSCCSCAMVFKNITNLVKHIRTHTQEKPFICKDCGRGFTQATNLRNHLSVHFGINAVKCDLCSFSCKTPGGLLKHKKKHAEGREVRDLRKVSTREFECSVCGKRFRFYRNLIMHMKSHETTESLCTNCGKLLSSKSKLSEHMRNCHGEACVCTVCGKVMASTSLLRAHSKIHVTKKEFTCFTCYKTFAVKNYLLYHLKTHDERRRYSCEHCGKMFKVAASLKYHNRISCQKINNL